jgi:S-DNA-T family DNA segregation ATPase FtsK/SpoIIIE
VTADSTATVEDIARAIADNDPLSSQLARAPHAALTLAVAPPTSSEPVVLAPDLLIGDAPIGSGFNAAVVVARAPRAVGGEGRGGDHARAHRPRRRPRVPARAEATA